MTTPTRLERSLPSILGDLAAGPIPDYIDDVLVQTARKRQRPGWTFPERWLPMADIASRPAYMPRVSRRTIGLALVIIALIVVGTVVFIGSRQTRLPTPFGPAANGLITYESNGDIFVGDPVTGSTRLVVGGQEADRGPSYSADGTWIGFLRVASPKEFDVYVVRPDGSDLRRLTPMPISNQSWVQWVPDSTHIATIRDIVAADGGCATTICSTSQLDLIDLSGKARTIATAEGMDYVQFRPPDAHELMYRARVDGKWGLFAMDTDGTPVRTLAEPVVPGEMDLSFSMATYSANGDQIFYEHGNLSGCCQLWVMNADGTDPHLFRPLGTAWDGQAVVSPDGTRVAFWHNLNDGPAHGITVARTDGTGEPIEIGPVLAGGAHWAWSPDSSRILMFPNDLATGKAYLLDPDGGTWKTVPWTSSGDIDWQRLAPPG
jgi:hypothetical protein